MDIKHLGFEEIKLSDIPNLKIGHYTDEKNATGVTALIAEKGMAAACDVRGGGPASRETTLLNPLASADKINAILLSGGSAFGLEASCGAAEYLEENGIGYPTGYANVPLICQSCIYDLGIGSSDVRPDKKMGYEACKNAFLGINKDEMGNVGAGMGATVGKAMGADLLMKSGLGSYALKIGSLMVGAIVVVNALGDIYDFETHEKLAGLLNKNKDGFMSCEETLIENLKAADHDNLFTSNTTIGAVFTNASFNKMEMARVASQAHNGYARCIYPVHTSADGDSIYAASLGDVKANLDLVSLLGGEAMARAIKNAVLSAKPAFGYKAAESFLK